MSGSLRWRDILKRIAVVILAVLLTSVFSELSPDRSIGLRQLGGIFAKGLGLTTYRRLWCKWSISTTAAWNGSGAGLGLDGS